MYKVSSPTPRVPFQCLLTVRMFPAYTMLRASHNETNIVGVLGRVYLNTCSLSSIFDIHNFQPRLQFLPEIDVTTVYFCLFVCFAEKNILIFIY